MYDGVSDFWDSSNLDFGGDGGSVNDTESYVSDPPDASGGTGSFLPQLVGTLTNGLQALANTTVLQALGQGSQLYTVDAYGDLVPKSAAGTNNAQYRGQVAPVYSPLKDPKVLIAGGVVVLLLVVLIARS